MAGETCLAAPLPTPRLGIVSEPSSTPGTAPTPSPAPPADRRWTDWRRQIGRQVRALRDATGLSQERLARLAGTNQAALSRLERGRGSVPLSLLARVGLGLAGNVLDRSLLGPDGERFLSALEAVAPGGLERRPSVRRDPGLDELVQCCVRASGRQRKVMLVVARALRVSVGR
jgi:transcriptional regulator with XRE-family HTH domain